MALNDTKAKVKGLDKWNFLDLIYSAETISIQDTLKTNIDSEELMGNIIYQFHYKQTFLNNHILSLGQVWKGNNIFDLHLFI